MRRTTTVSAVFLIVIIGLLLEPSLSILPSVPKANAAARTIVLVGSISGWNASTNKNPDISVDPGDTVIIQLSSTDTTHQFVIGAASCSSAIKCSSFFGPATSTSFMFTVDFPSGVYTYYCSIHPISMFGKFIVRGPDFVVAPNPSTLTIDQGFNDTSTIAVKSINGFSGPISLTATPSPTGPAASLNVTTVTVPAGGAAASKLTVAVPLGTPPGLYNINVVASNGTVSHSTAVSVTVPTPDFRLSATLSSMTIPAGALGNNTISINGVNGFNGTVVLSSVELPLILFHVVFSPSNVSLTPKSASATARISLEALGSFNITVSGTSGALVHSTRIMINGPNFEFTRDSSSVSVQQGSSANLTITFTSLNGFSSTVTLSATVSPRGPEVTVSPSRLWIVPTPPNVATITIVTTSSGPYGSLSTSPGSYTINVTGILYPSGSQDFALISHSETIRLTVTSSGSFLENPVIIGGIVATAAVATTIAIYFLRRKPKT
jgi:plastocyanin